MKIARWGAEDEFGIRGILHVESSRPDCIYLPIKWRLYCLLPVIDTIPYVNIRL